MLVGHEQMATPCVSVYRARRSGAAHVAGRAGAVRTGPPRGAGRTSWPGRPAPTRRRSICGPCGTSRGWPLGDHDAEFYASRGEWDKGEGRTSGWWLGAGDWRPATAGGWQNLPLPARRGGAAEAARAGGAGVLPAARGGARIGDVSADPRQPWAAQQSA